MVFVCVVLSFPVVLCQIGACSLRRSFSMPSQAPGAAKVDRNSSAWVTILSFFIQKLIVIASFVRFLGYFFQLAHSSLALAIPRAEAGARCRKNSSQFSGLGSHFAVFIQELDCDWLFLPFWGLFFSTRAFVACAGHSPR